jgi:hypothetical protein
MQSPAKQFVREVSGTAEQNSDGMFSNVQIASLEPQELMEFLEFCAGKIAMAQQDLELT